MAETDPFVAHCVELLGATGAVRARRMFGGHGLYLDGLFVAILADGRLYLKTSAGTRPVFETAGSAPFRYVRDGRAMTLGYWSAPDDAMDSPTAMQPWARLAQQAALAASAAKAAKAPAAAGRRKAARRGPG